MQTAALARMHSSRMRTVRCSSRLLGGGVSDQGVSDWGVSAQRAVCPGGVCREGLLPDIPPVNRIADACENITLPQLRCGR